MKKQINLDYFAFYCYYMYFVFNMFDFVDSAQRGCFSIIYK